MDSETPIYDERLLGAPDVCNNCFQIIKRERLEPARNGLDDELESHYERDKVATEIGYGPADTVSEQKGVFCDCGVESARHRTWTDADFGHSPGHTLGRPRFKDLCKQAMRTCEEKGVSINRRTFAHAALGAYADGADVDEAIGRAVERAVATAAATDTQERQRA